MSLSTRRFQQMVWEICCCFLSRKPNTRRAGFSHRKGSLPALSLNPSICERNNLWTLKQHVLVLKTTDYAAARNAALPKRFAYAMRAR